MNTIHNPDSIDKEDIGLKKYIVKYIRRWRLFVGVFIFSFIPAILYLLLVPRTYEIFAQIQIQDDEGLGSAGFGLSEAAGLMKSFGIGGGVSSSISLSDEMAILSSNKLLREVADTLNLNIDYYKPGSFIYRMYRDSPLIIDADSNFLSNLSESVQLKVTINKQGKVKIKVKTSDSNQKFTTEFNSLPSSLNVNGGMLSIKYNEKSSFEKPFKMKIVLNPLSWVAEDFSEQIVVEDLSKTSNVIELGYKDYERQRGLDILNTLMKLYNDKAEEKRVTDANKSLIFIKDRIQEMLSSLLETEIKIEVYKSKNKMTDLEYDLQFYVGQMLELQTKIIELETQSQVISMIDDYVKDPQNKYNLVPMLISHEGETGGSIMSYNELLLERIQLLITSEPESPLIIQLNEQIDQLRETVFLSISNAREGIRFVVNELKDKENQILKLMGDVPALEREYISLKRQQEINQGIYLILLQKKEELELTLGVPKERGHIVDSAYIKKKSVAPRKLYAGLGIIVFTLIFPILWIEGTRIFRDIKHIYKEYDSIE